jgi:pimeloyl-ACP methyl ester carboxylesterase
MDQKTITADGFDLRYQESGDGPAVVVIHGAGGPRWSPALDLLAQDHHIILLELPGFGTEVNDRSQSLGDLEARSQRSSTRSAWLPSTCSARRSVAQ